VTVTVRWRSPVEMPVPVIVVGNVSVGGTGKTPFVIWLAGQLQERNLRVGIVTLEFLPNQQLGPQVASGLGIAVELLAPQLWDRYNNDRWLVTKAGISIRDTARMVIGPKYMLAKVVIFLVIIATLIVCDEAARIEDALMASLRPMLAVSKGGGKLVMLSTAIYPAFSNEPAAFTRAIVTGELRNRLGFEGVTITDALETPAVANFGGTAKVAVAGARAGADLLLFARLGPAERAWKALAEKFRAGKLSRSQFEQAAQRVLDLRAGTRR